MNIPFLVHVHGGLFVRAQYATSTHFHLGTRKKLVTYKKTGAELKKKKIKRHTAPEIPL